MEEDIKAVREALATIHAEVSALCSGEKRWTMHIPADPKRDSDLIISGAASDALAALDCIEAQKKSVPMAMIREIANDNCLTMDDFYEIAARYGFEVSDE